MEQKPDVFHVKVLFPGYSFTDENGQYRATGTSSIITGPIKVVVDTGGPWDKDKLIAALQDNGITPDEIDYVVCTHGHSDHIGNLNLFLNAKHIVGFDINYKDSYFDHDFKKGDAFIIFKDFVTVIPTPGHMHSDVSVVVKDAEGLGTVVVCGDLFESENDGDSWKEISEWPEEQIKNRDKVMKMADYIIPGHGPMFQVRQEQGK